MQRFREISEKTTRRIDRSMGALARVETLEELEIRFLEEAAAILPADCMCWNNWSADLSHLIDFRMDETYSDSFASLLEVFAEVVAHHPVIAAGQLAATAEGVMRLSDFESFSRFRENPLFREVYRHLDSNHQLAYTPSLLQDRRIVLTWNRRASDFTEREREVLHFMGLRLGAISHRIEERQQLAESWRALCGFVDARLPTDSVASLGTRDVVILSELLKSSSRQTIARKMGTRQDTLDKRLGSVRERLGLENHHQLLSALAELKSEASARPN
jgi:DNA-binding CsgD family transcriptional regulator